MTCTLPWIHPLWQRSLEVSAKRDPCVMPFPYTQGIQVASKSSKFWTHDLFFFFCCWLFFFQNDKLLRPRSLPGVEIRALFVPHRGPPPFLWCGRCPGFRRPQNAHWRSGRRFLHMHAVADAQLEGHPAPHHHHHPFELAGGFPLPVKAQLQRTCSRVTARTQAGLLRRSARREERKSVGAELIALILATTSVHFLSSPPARLSFAKAAKEKPVSCVLRGGGTDRFPALGFAKGNLGAKLKARCDGHVLWVQPTPVSRESDASLNSLPLGCGRVWHARPAGDHTILANSAGVEVGVEFFIKLISYLENCHSGFTEKWWCTIEVWEPNDF